MDFVFGIFVGMIVYFILYKLYKEPSGTFVIDFSDPMKDVCRLELEEDINIIYKKKTILLKIETHEAKSHN